MKFYDEFKAMQMKCENMEIEKEMFAENIRTSVFS